MIYSDKAIIPRESDEKKQNKTRHSLNKAEIH